MKNGSRFASVFTIMVLVAVGSAFAADGWQKLGNKTTVFKNSSEIIKIKKSDAKVNEIMFKVSGNSVEFTGAKLSLADGSSQDVALDQMVRPGLTTDVIAIDGGPKAITQIEVMIAASVGTGSGSRSVITVVGK